VSKVKVY